MRLILRGILDNIFPLLMALMCLTSVISCVVMTEIVGGTLSSGGVVILSALFVISIWMLYRTWGFISDSITYYHNATDTQQPPDQRAI
jgi:hypothetical protein